MEDGTQNSGSGGTQNNTNVTAEGAGSSGPIIGAIMIVAIILLGGLYFWGQRSGDEAMVENINTQSGSDETSSIEADLYDTDIDSIDAELYAS